MDLFVVVTDWTLLLSGGLDDMEVLRMLRPDKGWPKMVFPGVFPDAKRSLWMNRTNSFASTSFDPFESPNDKDVDSSAIIHWDPFDARIHWG